MASMCGFCKRMYDNLPAHVEVEHPVCTRCSGLIRFQDRQALQVHMSVCRGSGGASAAGEYRGIQRHDEDQPFRGRNERLSNTAVEQFTHSVPPTEIGTAPHSQQWGQQQQHQYQPRQNPLAPDPVPNSSQPINKNQNITQQLSQVSLEKPISGSITGKNTGASYVRFISTISRCDDCHTEVGSVAKLFKHMLRRHHILIGKSTRKKAEREKSGLAASSGGKYFEPKGATEPWNTRGRKIRIGGLEYPASWVKEEVDAP